MPALKRSLRPSHGSLSPAPLLIPLIASPGSPTIRSEAAATNGLHCTLSGHTYFSPTNHPRGPPRNVPSHAYPPTINSIWIRPSSIQGTRALRRPPVCCLLVCSGRTGTEPARSHISARSHEVSADNNAYEEIQENSQCASCRMSPSKRCPISRVVELYPGDTRTGNPRRVGRKMFYVQRGREDRQEVRGVARDRVYE